MLTPWPCSYRVHAHTVSVLTSHQTMLPDPHTKPPSFGSWLPSKAKRKEPLHGPQVLSGLDILHAIPPTHPCPGLTPPQPCPCCRDVQGEHLVLQEPGKNSPGIKLARACWGFIFKCNGKYMAGGKIQEAWPACGITTLLCPMVNAPLAPGWDAGWERGALSAAAKTEGLILPLGRTRGCA